MSRKKSNVLVRVLSSFGLSCVLLMILFLLTLFGTLEQVQLGLHDVQKRYFESWYVVHWVFGRVPVPLLGGQLTMWLLAVNLLMGGLVRVRKTLDSAGIIVAHVGIAMLLLAGIVKLAAADDGHLKLFEGQTADQFTDYYKWEVAVWDASESRNVKEYLISNAELKGCAGDTGRPFDLEDLPFELTISHFLRNCDAMPKGPNWEAASPTVEGYALLEHPPEKQAEGNLSGAFAVARDRATGERAEGLLWAATRFPWTFQSGGKTWAVKLRHTQYQMPFAIRLEKFTKEDHPGMTMARSYMSDVVKVENGIEEPVRIQMNEPLRQGGLVLFQSSYGPQNGERSEPYSVFSVVRNPSDKWPEISCYVIAAGLLFAFGRKMWKYVLATRARAARRVVAREDVPSAAGAPLANTGAKS